MEIFSLTTYLKGERPKYNELEFKYDKLVEKIPSRNRGKRPYNLLFKDNKKGCLFSMHSEFGQYTEWICMRCNSTRGMKKNEKFNCKALIVQKGEGEKFCVCNLHHGERCDHLPRFEEKMEEFGRDICEISQVGCRGGIFWVLFNIKYGRTKCNDDPDDICCIIKRPVDQLACKTIACKRSRFLRHYSWDRIFKDDETEKNKFLKQLEKSPYCFVGRYPNFKKRQLEVETVYVKLFATQNWKRYEMGAIRCSVDPPNHSNRPEEPRVRVKFYHVEARDTTISQAPVLGVYLDVFPRDECTLRSICFSFKLRRRGEIFHEEYIPRVGEIHKGAIALGSFYGNIARWKKSSASQAKFLYICDDLPSDWNENFPVDMTVSVRRGIRPVAIGKFRNVFFVGMRNDNRTRSRMEDDEDDEGGSSGGSGESRKRNDDKMRDDGDEKEEEEEEDLMTPDGE